MGGGNDAGAALAQAVALALQADRRRVVREAIDQRGGHRGIAKDLETVVLCPEDELWQPAS